MAKQIIVYWTYLTDSIKQVCLNLLLSKEQTKYDITTENTKHMECRRIIGSFNVSGKLPTFPSPKPKFCLKWEESVNAGRGGVGGQFPRNV